jgi:hypothetical protein
MCAEGCDGCGATKYEVNETAFGEVGNFFRCMRTDCGTHAHNAHGSSDPRSWRERDGDHDELICARCESSVAGTRVVKRTTTCKVPRLHLGQQRLIADCC